ncbi:Hypothetical protein, putative [Bodo saltans]|uniref:Uncharacterized protein n=1 Tax=Bodo saltans TaxID=75058 RepID=A0A0S4J774_BODSA|nr:Hypothetical protein, putative [Bodo saltans]|eukprot:CUG86034.1 Hypothetical protein, putative [Bodo saltans]
MSLPTTPYSVEGTTSENAFSMAFHALRQGEELAYWTPPALFVVTPKCLDDMIVPEVVIGIGTVNNNRRFFYFESLYDEFLARGGDDVNVLKSFIKALAFRRCRSVELTSLTSIFNKLFRHPQLDLEDWEDIASIVSDMNSKPLVDELVIHSKMATRQHRPCFYSHLMRFAAEQLETPCFSLALSIVDAINATGATWTEATMYHLLGAFCRIKDNMPYATILHIVTEWRDARLREDSGHSVPSVNGGVAVQQSINRDACFQQSIDVPRERAADSPFPTSIMSRILSLTERALGSDVAYAQAIMAVLGDRAAWDRCIQLVEASYEFEPPPTDAPFTFYLIDLLSVDVPALGKPQHGSCYTITFSSLRAMCERSELHQDTHSLFTSKLIPVRKLFRQFPKNIVVVPPEIEIALRIGSTEAVDDVPTSPAPFSHICPRCVMTTVPPHSCCAGEQLNAVHDCGLPSVLPSNGGAAQLSYFAKCGMSIHCQIGRSLMVVTSNAAVIQDLRPLSQRFASSWFSICDQAVVRRQ